MSQPWICEETDPFTHRIRYFDFPKKTQMPNNVKTYDGSDDSKDHLKIFQVAAKVERWAMLTWCHMFNSTVTGSARVWFDDLPSKSIYSYDDLEKAFLANFLQQKKCIKDPVEIHHIKQREGESTEDFVQRFNAESRHVKGAPECMRISEFMHRITNPELIKRLHDNIPKSVKEMIREKDYTKFLSRCEDSFPPLGEGDGTEGPMIIEAEIGGHFIHRIYVDGGSASEILIIPLECALIFGSKAQISNSVRATEERIKVTIHPEYPEQTIAIGSTLTDEGRKVLCDLLRRNLDIFAWKPADMTRVLRHIGEHRLKVREGCLPIIRKKRSHASERNKAIQEEVKRLVDAGIMKEVHYHSWLSNPVMVKKHDGSWIMCVDFKDLNKACPKDGYPLPEIDWKNAEATYQRLVDKEFQKQTGRNLELNPKKCTFGIEEGMFLGYKVNTKGIKVCLDKVYAVLSLPSPKCLKDVQKLNRKLASLNRLLFKSAEKSMSFFKTLKKCTKKSDFQWTAKAKVAFKQIKKQIAELPTLTAQIEREELIFYLAAARESASAVLMTEREIKQMLVYFVSRALQSLEINFTPMEKLNTNISQWANLDGFHSGTSSCVDGSGACLILTNPEGAEFTYALRFRFDATNNGVEYETLIAGLRITEQMGVKNLQTNVDSCLVANQVNQSYIAKEPGMIQYLEKVKTLFSSFKKISIKHVPISENKKADALSKIASTNFAHITKEVLVEELNEKSINEAKVLAVVKEEGDTWMTPIYNYLTEETLPAE
uniref:Uncharacterized protein n=1 Tax=Tanacetum cinerariifolium TaxID=118510 RepID=A0A699HLT2_TANCI|nr:hypothetical protein [Tanacetum cinerariifolium]